MQYTNISLTMQRNFAKFGHAGGVGTLTLPEAVSPMLGLWMRSLEMIVRGGVVAEGVSLVRVVAGDDGACSADPA